MSIVPTGILSGVAVSRFKATGRAAAGLSKAANALTLTITTSGCQQKMYGSGRIPDDTLETVLHARGCSRECSPQEQGVERSPRLGIHLSGMAQT